MPYEVSSSGAAAAAAAAAAVQLLQRQQQRWAIQQCPHLPRRSVTASDDTRRIEINCAFPGPAATRCCSCFSLLWFNHHSAVDNLDLVRQSLPVGGVLAAR